MSGEMDYEHAEELHASLATALDGAPAGSDIVVDLQNSSFCDSSGLNVLLSVRLEALKRGVHLVLAAPSHQMIRLLEFTGSDDLFTYVPVVTD
ncbi:anti-anti-sigma factor [Streptomyces sp. SFB5A]|uniref:Anti-sigma factor antagonist n=1 Tax=Streptomyces nymphaeiformis TaxID=2663842 RepID=A0A7W7XGS3_9ACTN|nr:anti-anti-sigma factor [Streptomyces nymphaeiformis]